MRIVKGYRIIDVPVGMGAVLHPLYVKEHNNPLGTNKGRTLFVGNVDYAKERTLEEIDGYLRSLFEPFGEIASVSVSDNKQVTDENEDAADEENSYEDDYSNSGTRFAHLVFSKKASIKSALSFTDSAFYELTKLVAKSWGIGAECQRKTASEIYRLHSYRSARPAELKEEVEEYMKDFDERELIDKVAREKRTREPDDDGFVVVKQRSKKKRVEEKRGSGAPRDRVKKDEKELTNFYKFQIREQKQKKLFDLRKKFEEDREKVAIMKASRKFKPF